ncbi:MAG: VanZ family protein [Kangiellaceae bacterium]|nr:VanZ family protein [Kangiellaceae bacterium]
MFLLILFISIFLFVGGPSTHDLRVYFEFWQLGHFILFALIILLLTALQIVNKIHWAIQFIGVGFICLLLGLVTEYLQKYFGRSFSITDLVNDIIGGYAGFFTAQIIRLSSRTNSNTFRRKIILRITYFSIILGLALFTSRFFIKAAINEVNIRADFPILSNFETPFERVRWQTHRGKTEIASQYARSGNNGMKMTYFPAKYPSLSLRDFNGDWIEFTHLNLSIFNVQKHDIKLILKIYDHQHHHTGYRYDDRFHETITLAPGWNELSYSLDKIKHSPKNREMDMDEIFSFSLFMIGPKQPATIYIDNVFLLQQ